MKGGNVIFKSLAISNIVHSVLIKTVPNSTVEQLNIIKNNFFGKGKKPKIKHSTQCNNYENSGLKRIDILYKIIKVRENRLWHLNLIYGNRCELRLMEKGKICIYIEFY